jgi:hypothetical protein
MRVAKSIIFSTLLAVLVISTDAWSFPHANIESKDTLDAYTGRSYKEGSSATLSLVIGHGCTQSGESYSTRMVTALFPNGLDPDLGGIAYTTDGTTKHEGNAVFGIKPEVDYHWKEIQPITSNVPTYYSHGAKTTDVRAVHWRWGYIPDNFMGKVKVSVNFPKFEPNTCYNKIKVFIPIVQYCAADSGHQEDHAWKRDRLKKKNIHRVYAWIKEPTSMFPADTVVAPGYSAYLDIVRDLTTNPLPATCGGAGQTVELYPSAADIDTYLPFFDGQLPVSGSGGGGHVH